MSFSRNTSLIVYGVLSNAIFDGFTVRTHIVSKYGTSLAGNLAKLAFVMNHKKKKRYSAHRIFCQVIFISELLLFF